MPTAGTVWIECKRSTKNRQFKDSTFQSHSVRLGDMKSPAILLVALVITSLAFGSPTEIRPLPPPTTAVASQSRTALKHRKRPLIYTSTIASVAQIIALNQQLPAGVKNASVRGTNAPISPIESKVYSVTGDLWRVKMEDNDDEYHLEISAPGGRKTANRIIVEIPPDASYAATRKTLLSLLPGDFVFKPKTSRDFARPLRLRVTGYAFFDGHHWTSKSVRGNKHGTAYTATLWELHPAWKIEPAQ